MISANVDTQRQGAESREPVYHDAYLVKPLRLQDLIGAAKGVVEAGECDRHNRHEATGTRRQSVYNDSVRLGVSFPYCISSVGLAYSKVFKPSWRILNNVNRAPVRS
ncbi:MAG: hypothetical protein R3F37_04930 [Candidatus Competibacteraceae bacterium]